LELLEIPLLSEKVSLYNRHHHEQTHTRQRTTTSDTSMDMEIVSFGVCSNGGGGGGPLAAVGGAAMLGDLAQRNSRNAAVAKRDVPLNSVGGGNNTASQNQSMLHSMIQHASSSLLLSAGTNAPASSPPTSLSTAHPPSPSPSNSPNDDIVLSVAFVYPFHTNAPSAASRHNDATLNFYKVNLSQLSSQSQRDKAVTLISQQETLLSAGGIPRSFSTPVLNQSHYAIRESSPSPLYSIRSHHSSTSSSSESTPEHGRPSSTTPLNSTQAKVHHYASDPSFNQTSFSRSLSQTDLSSIFDIKRSKKQIPFNARGSWSLHSVPMCHYPHFVTLTKNINGRKVTEKKRIVLISATEKQMHCFIQDERNIFLHVDILDIFPEISTNKLLSSIITMDVFEENDRYRVVAIGGQNGWIRLTVYDLHELTLTSSCQIFLNGPISSLKFFKDIHTGERNDPATQQRHQMPVLAHINQEIRSSEQMKHQPLNLVVAESIGRTLIYTNVLCDGLKSEQVLGEYDDSVSCLEVADLFGSGYTNIIVGTYSKKMFIYSKKHGGYVVNHTEYFESPVYAIKVVDIVRDGVQEIVVLTMYQVCIMQIDLGYMENVLKHRLSKYRIIHQLAEEIRQSRDQIRRLEMECELRVEREVDAKEKTVGVSITSDDTDKEDDDTHTQDNGQSHSSSCTEESSDTEGSSSDESSDEGTSSADDDHSSSSAAPAQQDGTPT